MRYRTNHETLEAFLRSCLFGCEPSGHNPPRTLRFAEHILYSYATPIAIYHPASRTLTISRKPVSPTTSRITKTLRRLAADSPLHLSEVMCPLAGTYVPAKGASHPQQGAEAANG